MEKSISLEQTPDGQDRHDVIDDAEAENLESHWMQFAIREPQLARKILSQTEESKPPGMHLGAWLKEKASRIRLALFLYNAFFPQRKSRPNTTSANDAGAEAQPRVSEQPDDQ